jgi:hypothetical protein
MRIKNTGRNFVKACKYLGSSIFLCFLQNIHDPVETWWSSVTSQMQNTSTLSSGSSLLAPYPPSSPSSSRQADSPTFFLYYSFYVKEHICRIQGCGSGSILDPDSIRSVDPYSESGSRRAKMTHKSRKDSRNFMF